MNKLVLCLIALVFSAVLVGCSSSGSNIAGSMSGEPCMFPGTRQLAPGWICDEPVPEWVVTAPGFSKETNGNTATQQQQAASAAKTLLLKQYRLHVYAKVKKLAASAGGVDAKSLAMINASLERQIVDQTFTGIKLVKSARDPAGRIWVLAGVNGKTVETLTSVAVKHSYDVDPDVWQKLRGTKTLDELADAIAAQKVVDAPAPQYPALK